MSDEQSRGIGDNSRIDPTDLLRVRPEMIDGLLEAQYQPLAQRGMELEAAHERWVRSHTNDRGLIVIADQADNDATSDFFRQLASYAGPDSGEVEEARKKVKKPIFDAGKAIDVWFSGIRRTCQDAMGQLNGAQSLFAKVQEARLRAERERAAQVAKEEADRLAVEARKTTDTETVGRWLDAEENVQKAEKQAAASATELLRSKSALGTTTSVREKWTYSLTDMKALCAAVANGQVPADFLTVNDRVVKAAIAGTNGRRTCPGLSITPEFGIRRTGT